MTYKTLRVDLNISDILVKALGLNFEVLMRSTCCRGYQDDQYRTLLLNRMSMK